MSRHTSLDSLALILAEFWFDDNNTRDVTMRLGEVLGSGKGEKSEDAGKTEKDEKAKQLRNISDSRVYIAAPNVSHFRQQ